MSRSWGEGWRPLVCVYKVSSTCGGASTHGGIWGALSICGISGWGDTYGENLLLFLGHADGGMCEYSMCVMTVFECICCMLEHVLEQLEHVTHACLREVWVSLCADAQMSRQEWGGSYRATHWGVLQLRTPDSVQNSKFIKK